MNSRIHLVIHELALEMLEAVTALDLDSADALLQQLQRAHHLHARAEEAEVLPRYQQLGPFPRGAAPELVEADHWMVEKSLAAAERGIRALRVRPVRRFLIEHLDAFLRVKHVLEHHDARERDHVYPSLEVGLSLEDQALVRAALLAASP